jgi:sugar O-acyltransferase (sialic acid O-acetyltransferase NeuD family)
MNKELIILGAGGHAKVLLSLINELKLKILGVCAPELSQQGMMVWRGIPVLNISDDQLISFKPEQVALVNAIGNQKIRHSLFQSFKTQGYEFPTLIHPSAYLDKTACIEEGSQIMAGVMIQADVYIGKNVIINTRASIDHDCIIEDDVHIAPGAILCGSVRVKKGAFIACGAAIADGMTIGEGAIVGTGVSIVRDVLPQERVIPASVRKKML